MSIPQEALLKYQTKLGSYRTPLVLTYHSYLKPINKIVKNLQPLLNKDPYLNQIFSSPPLILYRQPPNLKLLLTSTSLPNERFITGTFPCNSPKCHLCPNINTNPTITGPNGVPKSPEILAAIHQISYMQFHAIFALKQSILEKQATQSDNG